MKVNYKVTYDCPANCKCCQERLNNFEKYKDETIAIESIYKKIIDGLGDIDDPNKHISITGGEPTLISNLPEIVGQFTRSGITVGIDTNGWNIDSEWLEKMEAVGLSYILFSYYSSDKDLFDSLRGSMDTSLFSKTNSVRELLKDYKDKGGKIKIRQQVVIMKENYFELPKLLKMAIDSGFDAFSTAYFISHKRDHISTLEVSDIESFRSLIIPQMKKKLADADLPSKIFYDNIKRLDELFSINGVSDVKLETGVYREAGGMCNEKRTIIIYPNGDALPCLGFDYVMDENYVENIGEKSIKEIMDSDTFAKFWKQPYSLCERCSSGKQVWLDLI